MIIKKSEEGKEVKIMVYEESKGIGKSTKMAKEGIDKVKKKNIEFIFRFQCSIMILFSLLCIYLFYPSSYILMIVLLQREPAGHANNPYH